MEYSILITDDEAMTREALSRHFMETGLFTVETASDGEEALEKIRSGSYDAVMLDIVMPRMTGLEVLKGIQEIDPAPVKIILSGYDRFSYAQQAVSLGVNEFLLKPVTAEKIHELAGKLADEISERRLVRAREEEALRYVENMKPVLVDRFLEHIVTGTVSPGYIRQGMTFYSIDLPGRYFCCVMISLGRTDGRESEYSLRPVNNVTAIRLITDACDDGLTVRGFGFANDDIGLIFNSDTPIIPDRIEGVLREAARELSGALRVELTAGAGNQVEGLDKLSLSFRQARSAFLCNRYEHFDVVVFYSDLGETSDLFTDDLSQDEIYEGIRSGNIDMIKECIAAAASGREVPGASRKSMQFLAGRILLTCQRICNDYGLEKHASEIVSAMPALYGGFDVLDEPVDEMLLRLVSGIRDELKDQRSEKCNYLVDRARKIIAERYMEDLSVSSIADELSISKNYFGKLFKNHMDTSVSGYINGIRVQKAIELLKNTNMKVYEIGDAVGYNDQHYSSISFKKVVGVSPSEFRDIL